MKKICLFFVLCLTLSLVGCSRKKEGMIQPSFVVLSTTAMIDDLVGKVGGDRLTHEILIVGAIDPHSYELVKGDDEKIDEANIVFFNGLNLEHGASLNYKISRHRHAVSLGGFLLANYPDLILKEKNQIIDPHVWMDVALWAKTIDPIVEALSQEDPEGRSYYEERGRLVKEEMLSFHESIKSRLSLIQEDKRYLVTSHDAFGYFTRSYLAEESEQSSDSWRKRCIAPEGLAPDGQIGAFSLQKVIDHLIEKNIPVIFAESNVNVDSLRKIQEACKQKKMEVQFSTEKLYGDSMGEKGSSASTYFGMMDHNVTTLIREWEYK